MFHLDFKVKQQFDPKSTSCLIYLKQNISLHPVTFTSCCHDDHTPNIMDQCSILLNTEPEPGTLTRGLLGERHLNHDIKTTVPV